MANVYASPVLFTKEKNVFILSARVQFGASGAAVLNTTASKGFCSVANESVAFSGATTNSTTTLSSVSSFDGLFYGMVVTGPAGELGAGTITANSFSAAGKSVTLSAQSITTNTAGAYNATGGRYRFQLGTQAAKQLTPFVKILGVNVRFDVSTGSASGSAVALQSAPVAPNAFVVDNNISVRTIPQTATSGSTDASFALQFGYGQGPGTGFVAAAPGDGEIAYVEVILGNSTAP